MVHAARANGGQVFDIDPKYFDKDFDRATCPELQKLLSDPSKPGEQYLVWASLLFACSDVERWFPFQSPVLTTVCIIHP